jgi:hypothetical protein
MAELTPHTSFLDGIISDKWRDSLATFVMADLLPQHREKFVAVTTRILFGKFGSSAGKGKRSKDTPGSRRAAIVSFMAAFESEELAPFVFMMLRMFAPGLSSATAVQAEIERLGADLDLAPIAYVRAKESLRRAERARRSCSSAAEAGPGVVEGRHPEPPLLPARLHTREGVALLLRKRAA